LYWHITSINSEGKGVDVGKTITLKELKLLYSKSKESKSQTFSVGKAIFYVDYAKYVIQFFEMKGIKDSDKLLVEKNSITLK
jgi:hypothetical protein